MYGLILSGIAFLYVGFTWTDLNQLAVSIVQAVVFVFIAYFGVKKSIFILIAGYFLHGLWDLGYTYVGAIELLPPHYDIFCLVVDFIMGGYLLLFRNRFAAPEAEKPLKIKLL